MKPTSRALALDALRRWREGREFADKIVAQIFPASQLRSPDRAFALELFYGVLRNLTLLDFWIGQLRPNPVDATARDLLRLGLYQVLLIETADHAAVFETVELARPRARSLVNAILRRALREESSLTNSAEALPWSVRYSEPEFLVEKWNTHFGAEAAEKLCRWNNQPAANYARINPLKIDAAGFAQKYPESAPVARRPLFVTMPEPARALAEGDCYMQDPSTALAVEFLEVLPNDVVLDACAAPGGKSAYLAAMMKNTGALVAADRDLNRMERLRSNLVRLSATNATLVQCDWLDPESIRAAAFRAQSFDKILVDVPCSNTGVMRRRVDVRWRLRVEDFARLPAQQLAILRNIAPLLRPGGVLVYSTCSLEPEENEEVVAAFLRKHSSFRLTNLEKCLPIRDDFDGAFAARLLLA